jgi:hypothetical protein
MFQRLVCLSLIALSAAACSKETTSSKNIKTGGIAALIDVYADSDTKATVHVELRVGGSSSNTYVDLEGPDKLVATADDQEQTLSPRDTGVYEGSFSGVGEDTQFTVTLDRGGDDTASDNSGSLPAPFTLEKPAGMLSRKADALDISWSPASSDKLKLEIDGDCIYGFDKGVPDTGAYTVEAGKLESTGSKPEACDLDVTATRSRDGSADAKFDPESWFRLHQRRHASFVSNP